MTEWIADFQLPIADWQLPYDNCRPLIGSLPNNPIGNQQSAISNRKFDMDLREIYRKRITVARVYGIPVRIDYRWFLVVGLSSWLISRNLQTNILQLGGFQLPPL